ncbi:NAD(P)-binding protein [Xylaria sp. CBS 124048]|nr:NAD(P)-binding protein [Xylaria sp. CBS 124048]
MATEKKILLITGGNTGLGLEAVKALCQSQIAYEIIVGCRTVSKGESAIAEVKKEYPQTVSTLTTLQVDLVSDESLEKAIAEITSRYGRLDILVNNGGASFDFDIAHGRKSIREGFNAAWDTNVAGTHVLTMLSVPLLLQSAGPRVIFLSSGTSSLTETAQTDNANTSRLNSSPEAGWPKGQNGGMLATSYRSSKAGLNMLMREWRRILLNDGVKVFSVSPGFLATGLSGLGAETLKKMGALDPSVGAHILKDVIEGQRDQDEGRILRKDTIQPW